MVFHSTSNKVALLVIDRIEKKRNLLVKTRIKQRTNIQRVTDKVESNSMIFMILKLS